MAFAFLSPHEEVRYVLERKDIIMDNIQIFKNESFGEVRVAGTSEVNLISTSNFLGREINVYGSVENPLFLAKDVAEWIEHSDVSTMVRTVDEDEKLTQTLFVSAQSVTANQLVVWLDRINRTLVHAGDNIRTQISFAKQDLALQRKGY